ncbi:MAG: hypothetical protein V9E94_04755 [Microthrixaceae bacterium]
MKLAAADAIAAAVAPTSSRPAYVDPVGVRHRASPSGGHGGGRGRGGRRPLARRRPGPSLA